MRQAAAARQAALAAEERALYGYALIGPRLDATDRQLVRACIAAHTALQTSTSAAVTAAGAAPVAPRPDYPDLYPVADVAMARARAVDLEQTCAAAWRLLYAQLVDGGAAQDRANTQHALTGSAVRATRWRMRDGDAAPTVPFPGIS